MSILTPHAERVACEQKGPQKVRDVRDRGEHLGVGARFYASPIPGFDYDREYKMLKPKVLFHTWAAIYGSGIFDGAFALPKLDYVTKIKSNASSSEPNIAVLNLERDLKDALPKVMYQENYSADLNLMDYLRRSNQASVQCARCVARPPLARGKVADARALAGNGGTRSFTATSTSRGTTGYRTRAGSQGHVLRSIPLKDFRFNMCAFAIKGQRARCLIGS
ncbi:hypothetical protein Q5P01_021938 [Channa striata]|uniref:Uncharacterized protein n=1 Tax=Channa striata TaxID=64152 RepID=A0AA88IW76_CHASR|nr:hypothetical protein Q5P01_021938 [Channa striata]